MLSKQVVFATILALVSTGLAATAERKLVTLLSSSHGHQSGHKRSVKHAGPGKHAKSSGGFGDFDMGNMFGGNGSKGGFGDFDMGNMFGGNDDFFGGSKKGGKKAAKRVVKKGGRKGGFGDMGGDLLGNDFFGGSFGDDESSKKIRKSKRISRRPRLVKKRVIKKVVIKRPAKRIRRAKARHYHVHSLYLPNWSHVRQNNWSEMLGLPSRINDGSSIIKKYQRYWVKRRSGSRRGSRSRGDDRRRQGCAGKIDPKLKQKLIKRLQARMRRALYLEVGKIEGAFKKAFKLSRSYVNKISFNEVFNSAEFQALFKPRCNRGARRIGQRVRYVRPAKRIIIKKKKVVRKPLKVVVKKSKKVVRKPRRVVHHWNKGNISNGKPVFIAPTSPARPRSNILDQLKNKILIGSSNPETYR